MGELRQRGQIWWIRFYKHGRRVEESSGSSRKQDAIDLLKVREADVVKGVSTPAAKLRFDAAVQAVVLDYKMNARDTTAHVERRITKHLAPYFGNRRLRALADADIVAYAVARQEAGASNASINRELAIVRRAFKLAKVPAPTIPHLKESAARRGFFAPEQLGAVLLHLSPALQPVVRFAAATGWRVRSEVLPLTWASVDWQQRQVRLEPGATKNEDARTFPFTAALEAVLVGQWAEHQRLVQAGRIVPYLFHRNGKPIRHFRKAWGEACIAAGVPGRLLHDLRRSAVRTLELSGVPRATAMQMVGHRTESIYRRYAIVDRASLEDAAARIDAMGTIAGTVGASSRSGNQRK